MRYGPYISDMYTVDQFIAWANIRYQTWAVTTSAELRQAWQAWQASTGRQWVPHWSKVTQELHAMGGVNRRCRIEGVPVRVWIGIVMGMDQA